MISSRASQAVSGSYLIIRPDLSCHVKLCDDQPERETTLTAGGGGRSECEHNKCQQTTGAGANRGVRNVVLCGDTERERGTETRSGAFLGFLYLHIEYRHKTDQINVQPTLYYIIATWWEHREEVCHINVLQ